MDSKTKDILSLVPSYIVNLWLFTIEAIKSGNDGIRTAHLDCELDIRKSIAVLPRANVAFRVFH